MWVDLIKITFFTSVNHNFSVWNILRADTTGSNNWLKCLHGTAVSNIPSLCNSRKIKWWLQEPWKNICSSLHCPQVNSHSALSPTQQNCKWRHYTQAHCTRPWVMPNISMCSHWEAMFELHCKIILCVLVNLFIFACKLQNIISGC